MREFVSDEPSLDEIQCFGRTKLLETPLIVLSMMQLNCLDKHYIL